MKRILCLIYLVFICLCYGCSSSSDDTNMNASKHKDGESDSINMFLDDSVTDYDYESIFKTYYERFSETEGDKSFNKCVAFSKVMSKEYPDMLLVDYDYTIDSYIKPNGICSNFSIIAYRKHDDIKRQYNEVYTESRFICSDEKVKGYAVCGMKDGNLVLIKCLESGASYHILNKDSKSNKFISGQLITSKYDEYTIDGKSASKTDAEGNINDILNNISVVLISDGSLNDPVESFLKDLEDCSLSYKDAKNKCYDLAFKDVDKEDFFNEYSGIYTTNSGNDPYWTKIDIKKDGTFTGEYHNANTGSDTVEYSSFSGVFSNVKYADEDSYYLQCTKFEYNKDKLPNADEGYTYTEPFSLDDFSSFKLYKKGLEFFSFDDEDAQALPEYYEHEVYDWFTGDALYHSDDNMPDLTDRYILENKKLHSFDGKYLYGEKDESK